LAGTAFGRKPFCDVLCDLLRDVAGDAHYGHVARLAFGKLSDDGAAQIVEADTPAPASSSFSPLCVETPLPTSQFQANSLRIINITGFKIQFACFQLYNGMVQK